MVKTDQIYMTNLHYSYFELYHYSVMKRFHFFASCGIESQGRSRNFTIAANPLLCSLAPLLYSLSIYLIFNVFL
jgi:hypothetical protein